MDSNTHGLLPSLASSVFGLPEVESHQRPSRVAVHDLVSHIDLVKDAHAMYLYYPPLRAATTAAATDAMVTETVPASEPVLRVWRKNTCVGDMSAEELAEALAEKLEVEEEAEHRKTAIATLSLSLSRPTRHEVRQVMKVPTSDELNLDDIELRVEMEMDQLVASLKESSRREQIANGHSGNGGVEQLVAQNAKPAPYSFKPHNEQIAAAAPLLHRVVTAASRSKHHVKDTGRLQEWSEGGGRADAGAQLSSWKLVLRGLRRPLMGGAAR